MCDVADRVRLRRRSDNVDAEVTQVSPLLPSLARPSRKSTMPTMTRMTFVDTDRPSLQRSRLCSYDKDGRVVTMAGDAIPVADMRGRGEISFHVQG